MFEISKNQFLEYINEIKRVEQFYEAQQEFYGKYGASCPSGVPDGIQSLVNLLDDIYNPITRLVSYFCFELNFGKDMNSRGFTLNGKNIDISTPSKLYKFLVSEDCVRVNTSKVSHPRNKKANKRRK